MWGSSTETDASVPVDSERPESNSSDGDSISTTGWVPDVRDVPLGVHPARGRGGEPRGLFFSWVPEVLILVALAWCGATAFSDARGSTRAWRPGVRRLGSKRPWAPLERGDLALPAHWPPPRQRKRCATVYAAVVARHGARYPTVAKLDAVAALWDARCGGGPGYPRLNAWCETTRGLRNVTPAGLAPSGVAELAAAADLARLAPLGAATLGAVRTTSAERTVASCAAFVAAGWDEATARRRCANATDDALLRYPASARAGDDETPATARLAACQLDATLVAQGPPFGRWRWACQELLSEDARGTVKALAADDADALERALDPGRLAFGARLLRALDAGLSSKRRPRDGLVVDFFVGHDSTLLPLLGVLGLINGTTPRPAGLVPFAARLRVSRTACGEVVLGYGDRDLAVWTDIAAWRSAVLEGLPDDPSGAPPP